VSVVPLETTENEKYTHIPWYLRRMEGDTAYYRYRGYPSNCLNVVSVTVWQFAANGFIKKMITGGKQREFTAAEEIGAALGAGMSSAFICSPLELIMVQQQRKGASLASTIGSITNSGLINWGRGLWMTAMREGVYTAGYLGVTPVIRSEVSSRFPTWNEELCRIIASICGGAISCYLSHPTDTIKTCLQGDVERKRFTNHASTASALYKEGGIAAFYRGAPWRLFRQIGGMFLMDKIRVTVSPLLFPHRF